MFSLWASSVPPRKGSIPITIPRATVGGVLLAPFKVLRVVLLKPSKSLFEVSWLVLFYETDAAYVRLDLRSNS